MSRYKGQTNAAAIERELPYIVEIRVPFGGLGKTLDAMYEFHDRLGIKAERGKSRRDENGRNYIRWCFANQKIAAAFASEFGGAMQITSV
jgi:hypothetical protein